MNKNAIQKYAVWARNELIEQVKQRAFQYGISEKGYGEENAPVVNGRVLSPEEKRQRHEFVAKIQEQGYLQAVEEVAYTWFNRFIALRFMEVNDYLPTHIRVFSDASGEFKPEILKEALHIELEGLDKAKVSELLNASKTEELYRYLLLTQCNALHAILPEMFEKMGNYTEMLLPNNILKPDGVLGRLVTDIPEEDWRDAVQIIGWLYQYYNTEPKQAVFDGLKKNIKITKEKIPAATQLFTPDWIVRYMVENSLGRMWLESHPNDKLKANWKYYIEEAEQTQEVAEKLRALREQSPVKSPEDIKLIDPCMGSGHILVYAFEVLMQIYESEGYNARDAAKLILEKNLYGLDIDRRACQLAYFSLMMKARQYHRRIFTENVKPQVYHPAGWSDGEEYGSLIKVDVLPPKPEQPQGQLTIFDDYERDLRVWNFKRLLAQKYDVVVTNPPYMGDNGMNAKLTQFIKDYFPDSKTDFFAAFIEKCSALLVTGGYQAMITMESWMFLSSFAILRKKILSGHTIINLVHMPYLGKGGTSLGINFGTSAFVFKKQKIKEYQAQYDYIRYFETDDDGIPLTFPTINERYKKAKSDDFSQIPGTPIAYWVSDAIFSAFATGTNITKYVDTFQGIITGNNDKFLRKWYEVVLDKVALHKEKMAQIDLSKQYWLPYNKGGDFRKWYGNQEYIVYWKNGPDDKTRGKKGFSDFYLREYASWSYITSSTLASRYFPKGFLWDVSGSGIFDKSDMLYYLMSFIGSKVGIEMLKIINPTINYQVENIAQLPVLLGSKERVDALVEENIAHARIDWDSFETSWDFKHHPLINGERTVAEAFSKWKETANNRFDTLKANEEELNRIFIDIYGLQDELTPEVEEKDVTVHRIYDSREDIPESMAGSRYALTKQDVIKSFISYAVGCMFGRYSLDVEGLAFAGGEWDAEKYKTFIPDQDNIIPICDDEYFDDDIVGRFVEFVKAAYGADTLEDNLKFIADALGGRGTPREAIRSYFLNEFYKDHCKAYQKRPIYWLFDSGKKNGFKALIYLHRYSRDLLAKLRTDYVHEQQERYRTQLSHIAVALNSATGAERARLLKQQDKLTEQLKELATFEEKVHHLADQNIGIDMDDGVKKNYAIFADVLAKI
jgi:hypothetical protein